MKQFFTAVFLLTTIWCFSQDTDEPVKVRFDLNPNAQDRFSIDRIREFVVKGSPHLNEEHKKGKIISGKTITETLLRYNAYYDTFQVLDEQKKKAFVLKSPKVQVELGGKTYQLLTYEETTQDKALYYLPDSKNKEISGNKKQGYFCELSQGTTKLYSKTIKRIPKFSIPEHGYERFEPTAFVTFTHYYIKRKYRPAMRIKLSKKEVLFALNNKYNEVRAYMKENKLKAKTEAEVIKILDYYDTLD